MKLANRDIICVASASWDAMWVNAQHLMHRLAAANRVLYVNNLGLRAPGKSRGDWAKIKRRVVEWTRPATQVEDNVWVFSPVSIPLHGHATVRDFNRWNLARSLRQTVGELGFRDPILWTFLPLGEQLIGRLGESLVVYHCVDDYAANPGVPVEEIRAMEDRLLRRADLVITTHPLLFEDRQDRAREIAYFGNVANTAHFADRRPAAPPPELAALPRPIVGYHGNISGYKTDLGLLEKLARAMPDVSFVLVGPVGWGDPHTDVTVLETLPNVHFTGRIDYERLPDFLAYFDVGLLPLHDNPSTRRSFPMKFFEFMAAGKPIVATDLPAFAAYRDRPHLCRLVNGAEAFVSAIRNALDDDPQAVTERVAEARQNSWDVRAAQIASKVADVLAAREEGENPR